MLVKTGPDLADAGPLGQGCVTGGPRATTRPAKPFSVALANTLIFPTLSHFSHTL